MKRVNIISENPIEIKKVYYIVKYRKISFVTFQSFEIGGLICIQKLYHIVTI